MNTNDFPDGRDPCILPLSITMPNWPEYIKYCQAHLGDSPTRGIDAMGLSPKNPQAFLATLDLCNLPQRVLSRVSTHWDFIHLSFICKVRRGMTLDLTRLPVKLLYSPHQEDEVIAILDGSLADWLRCYQDDNWSPRLNQFLFCIYQAFKDMSMDCLTDKVNMYPKGDGYGFNVNA